MACAVSLCVQGVDRDDRPGQVSERFQQFRTAGISLDFASTATWPRTAPIPCARAATRCGAFSSLFRAPRTALPSTAITSRPPACAALVKPGANDLVEHVRADQGERAPERGLLRRPADRSEPGQHAGPGIGGPLADHGERP
jgi:hypothetical protein